MPVSITKIASEIAKTMSLKHHKQIAYKMIVENEFRMMVGLCVEPSRFSTTEFSVHTFIQALYKPLTTISLSIGNRIISFWEKKDLSEAIPIIQDCYEHLPSNSIASIIEEINNYKLIYRGSIDNRYELLAYSYIVINQYSNAKEYLKKIVSLEDDENADWFKDAVMRAKIILEMIKQEKWVELRNLLLSWQKETMTALKLPE